MTTSCTDTRESAEGLSVSSLVDPEWPTLPGGEATAYGYQELVQEAECIILCRACDGRIIFLNRFGLQFFGYQPEEIIGKNVVGTIVPPTDSAGRDLEEMIHAISRAPEQYVCNENENICKDGRRVWVGWRNKAVRDPSGKIRELICVGTDLTVQRQATERLKEYEARFRTVFETAVDGILLIERGTSTITSANGMMCRMLGYGESELIGKPVSVVHPDGEWARVAAVFESCDGGMTDTIKGFPLRRKDGTFLRVDVSGWVLSVSGQTYLAGLYRDATDRVTANEERRVVTQQLDALSGAIEASPAVIVQWRLDGSWSMTLVSENVSQFGYSSRELTTGEVGWKTIVHPHDLPALESCVELEAARRNGQFTSEYRIVTADQQIRHVVSYSQVARDAAGTSTGLHSVLLDVTQRQTVEQALAQEQAFRRALETSLRPGIIAFDLNGKQTYVSKAFCDMVGWTEAELLGGLPPYRYVQADTKKPFVPAREKILSGEADATTLEFRILRSDGTDFPGLVIGAPLENEKGSMLGWVASVADLTDRQQTAERISCLNDCFLGFGIDPAANIQRLVEVAGKIVRANCTAYNRQEGKDLVRVAAWRVPAGIPCTNEAANHVCESVIRRAREDIWVEHNLDCGKCLHGQAQGSRAPMHTYMGKALRCGNDYVGVLCALFEKETEPTQEEKRLFGVIAAAIGVEETRRIDIANLVENRLKLRALTSQLSVAEQEERRRIAHVLHDEVCQLLVAACLKLHAIRDLRDPADIRAATDVAGDLIRSATAHTRSLTSQISLEFLHGVRLIDAVQSECERLQRQHDITCTVEDDGCSASLDCELAAFLFQAIRELLFNVTQHAKARHVGISIAHRDPNICVRICDDGVGFDPSKRPTTVTSEGGFGLFSYSERLQYVGGSLEIESAVGQGTSATIVVPTDYSRRKHGNMGLGGTGA